MSILKWMREPVFCLHFIVVLIKKMRYCNGDNTDRADSQVRADESSDCGGGAGLTRAMTLRAVLWRRITMKA